MSLVKLSDRQLYYLVTLRVYYDALMLVKSVLLTQLLVTLFFKLVKFPLFDADKVR